MSPLRQALTFGVEPYEFLERCTREIGDTFTIRFPGLQPAVTTSDPELLRQLIGLRPDEIRSDLSPVPLYAGEHAVVTLDGQAHARLRRANLRATEQDVLKSYAVAMVDAIDRQIDRWQLGSDFELWSHARSMVRDCMAQCAIGATDDAERASMSRLLDRWTRLAQSPWVSLASLSIGGPGVRKVFAALDAHARRGGFVGRSVFLNPVGTRTAALREALEQEVDRVRQSDSGDHKDVLTQLARMRDGDVESFTRAEIVDQLLAMAMAGIDSTTSAICWAVHNIYSRPDVLRLAREEVQTVFPRGLNPSRIRELPYLDACIKESLRITPVFPVTARVLAKNKQIGGSEFPAGTTFWMNIYAVHRRTDLWDTATDYRPERFLIDPPAPHHYMPWGGGVRRCVHAQFSAHVMQVALARMIERTDLSLSHEAKPQHRGIIIRPSGGLRMRCVRRNAPVAASQSHSRLLSEAAR